MIGSKHVSLETAKRLKLAGFPQDSEAFWAKDIDPEGGTELKWQVSIYESPYSKEERYSAPGVYELLAAVDRLGNEMAVGWNDSGCFWHVRVGGRGTGNMMDGFGERFEGFDLEDGSLVETLAEGWMRFTAKD